MDTLLDPEKARTIQEEIRARVFERYADLQGVETQKHELNATLEALHDVTHLPVEEIEKIAKEVIQEYGTTNVPMPLSPDQFRQLALPQDITFEHLQRKIDRKKRAFYVHALAYVCVHLPLIYINLRWPVFPWVMFPLLGWGIGLGSHYLYGVHDAISEMRRKVQTFKSQIHQILDENIPAYHTEAKTRIFNGVYRMLMAESSQDALDEYLRNVDLQLPENEVKQVCTQLHSVREKYLKK